MDELFEALRIEAGPTEHEEPIAVSRAFGEETQAHAGGGELLDTFGGAKKRAN